MMKLKPRKVQARPELVIALATCAATLAITIWLWQNALAEAREYAEARFGFRVDETTLAIQQRMLAYEQMLRGGAALFAASNDVERNDWRAYVAALMIGQNYPGIQGIGFAKKILPADMDEHIQQVRAEGYPEYFIRPAGKRDEVTSIIYLEPFDWRNQRAFGYDMLTEPVRRAAMARARDTGEAALSGKVRLVQETDKDVQPGMLMFLPVYRKGMPSDTPEQRHEALFGYVYSPFRAADLMRGILGRATAEIDLEIFDGDQISEDVVLYQNSRTQAINPFITKIARLSINGHPWTLRFTSLPSFEARINIEEPRLTLITGVIISVLISIIVWFLVTSRRRNVELECRVMERTDALNSEVAERRRIEEEIRQLNDELEKRVVERTQQLQDAHRKLVDASRQAGRAEIATNVLHNVGNVLNSANVSATLVIEQVRESKIAQVAKISRLLQEHAADLGTFITADPKGRQIAPYLATLASDLANEHAEVITELDNLRKNIEHIKDIVSMQQSYAKVSGMIEHVSVMDLVEDALRFNESALARHGVQLQRDFRIKPAITVEKHKVVQILVNLIRNAKYACVEANRANKQIMIRVDGNDDAVEISVIDNGVGIPVENLTHIFRHGFTTRKNGHGFGLHSGAAVARELGGELKVYSAGPGRGATFTLKLPHLPLKQIT